MSDPFTSRDELRRYVEAQLKHPGLRDRLDLSVAFQNPRPLLHAAPLHALWWTIESSTMDRSRHLLSRHYLLEARYEEREFVIWFGSVTGFVGPSPRDVIRPAVHLEFPNTSRVHDEQQSGRADEYSLGAVITWMLEHEDRSDTLWDPVVYPLNGGRY